MTASTKDDTSSSDRQPPRALSVGMLIFPLASWMFEGLLQLARSLPPNSSEQLAAITVLFVTNRAYLYLMAATIVGLAAIRGSNDAPELGRRITDLTEELLYRPSFDKQMSANEISGGVLEKDQDVKPAFIQSLTDSGLQESLDQVSTETQALIIPLMVSFLLALSIFFLPFWTGAPTVVGDNLMSSEIQGALSRLLPTISQLWNVGLLVLFTRSEVRRLGYELTFFPDVAILEWIVAVSITCLACWAQLWPAQNFVNMCLAILVARAIQLDNFRAVVGALSLLTLYDATSVFLIPAAGASEILLTSLSSDQQGVLQSSSIDVASESAIGGSAMGSVAIQKLTSGTFQPGLLVTKIGDRLGGSLGLGDAVFPALLSNFVKRFDDSKREQTDRLSLFAVSMTGYLIGCFACEFAPLLSTSGLPALVFIIPSMLGSVVLVSAISGEVGELVDFDPKNKKH